MRIVAGKYGLRDGDLNTNIDFVSENIIYFSVRKKRFIEIVQFVGRFFIANPAKLNIAIGKLAQKFVVVNYSRLMPKTEELKMALLNIK